MNEKTSTETTAAITAVSSLEGLCLGTALIGFVVGLFVVGFDVGLLVGLVGAVGLVGDGFVVGVAT
jgi:hypothetical protein